ncbi:hypothetical protein DPMN_102732 [Dreissena polymorpha]|uniref:Uncharacterized protein n=1 Tax=Dreissena polymorpha TaxID=45954 RepID=A0A9D4LL21_DREPO|nr:hypothetical protein DPMN_102732 [Dreissena polymorpha]
METEAVFSYIQSTWLDSSIWAPEEWSVNRQTVRTNNDTEGLRCIQSVSILYVH